MGPTLPAIGETDRSPISDRQPHLRPPGSSEPAAEQSQKRVADGPRRNPAGHRAPVALFRFPYGSSSASTLALVNQLGYTAVGWTVDTLGWEGTSLGQSRDSVTTRALAHLQPGEIMLMHVGANPHDHSTLDADALSGIISAIRARGYQFVTLNDYF